MVKFNIHDQTRIDNAIGLPNREANIFIWQSLEGDQKQGGRGNIKPTWIITVCNT